MKKIKIPGEIRDVFTKNIVRVILLFSVFAQFSFVSLRISRSADNYAIINAMDDDAANAIDVTKDSYLLWDNHFIAYGNVYFRIAKLFNSLDPTATFQKDASQGEKETSIHFGLMLTSLVFFFLFTWLIASLISQKPEFRLVTMLILNVILFMDYNWVYLVFKAHPDIMLAFLVAFAFHLSIKYLHTKTEKYFWLAAIFWGFAVATKAVSVFFLPGLLFLFIPGLFRENAKRAMYFFLIAFVAYLVIGFPQNFRFLGLFNFMVRQQGFSLPATQASVTEWIQLIGSQAGWAIIAILVLKIILYKEGDEDLSRVALKLSPVFIVEMVYFFSKRITSPHEYYTLPLAGVLIVFAAHASTPVAKFIHTRLTALSGLKENAKLSILYGSFVLLLVFVPNSFQQVIKYEQRYREQSRKIYEAIISFQDKGHRIFIDPYVPFDNSNENTHKEWGITYEILSKGNASVLVLNEEFYSRFLDSIPSQYVQHDTPNWKASQDFYRGIKDKSGLTDRDGKRWEKTFDEKWEIWELKGE